tara:strand:- start:20513 stop:21286 length:774 start_codon:yes stop_codon:yes gene_type:complete
MSHNRRPYVLAETNYKDIRSANFGLAVLPWGATEAHNYHLPYATDNILAENVAIEATRKAWENKAKIVVLPTIPFGVNTGQIDVPFCINMNPSTQYLVLKDIVQVLDTHKIKKLVILNAHGGNHFKQFIRELSISFPEVFICALNWWQVTSTKNYFEEPGDHAGELETAVVMHLTPELVLPLSEAGNGNSKRFRIKALNESWIAVQREWTKITADTGVGNPKEATAEKGKLFFEKTTSIISDFLEKLYHQNANDMYE